MDKNIEDRYVVILAVLTQFIACFVGSMITIGLRDMQMDLSLNSWQVNLLSIIYYIVMISISLPISKVVSNFGIKRYLKLNMILLIFSLFLAGFAINAEMLIIARIIQGVCFAAFAVSVYVIVVKQISEEKLGPVLGLVSSAGYVGMTSAPTVSGFIISFLDWRWTFIFMVIFCVIAVWVTTRIETEWKEETPFNVTGSVFHFISMLMITMGIFSLDSIGIIPIAIGLISLVIFVKTERGKENQIFNLDIFKH